jgi:hypothetical protein
VTLPTFLGIGVERGGSTWLNALLAAHPDIYMPKKRKEVHFFDWYYERGFQWYEKFFPPGARASQYQAIGEFTPAYLFCPHCPERIASVPSIAKLILIIRNPVDRAYSWYSLSVLANNYRGSFEDFLSNQPEATSWGFYSQSLRSYKPDVIGWGFYSQGLKNYLRYFRKDQILVLINEHAVADVPGTKETLGRFLGVEVGRFPSTVGYKRANRSYVPRFQSIHGFFSRVALTLRERDLDWIVNFAIKFNIKRAFGEIGSLPSMKEETRQYLREIYENEIRELELLLEIDLSCWK